MKINKKAYEIISIILSCLLCIAIAFSLLGATLISGAKTYLVSDKFDAQIESMDLSSLTFVYNGEEITLERYVKDYLSSSIEGQIDSSFLGGIANLLNPFVGQITDFAVDQTLSSVEVNKVVKTQVHSIVDYLINSDVNEAKERIENGITLESNPEFNSDNATTYEEKVSIEVKKVVFQYIENESGITIDQIIIIASSETVNTLMTICRILAIILMLINIPFAWRSLLYFGAMANIYSAMLYVIVYNFNEKYKEMGHLVSYQFLKPIVDVYLPYGEKASLYGTISILVSVAIIIAIKVISDKKEKNKSQA
ncbi:MAG: hypothetical protein IKV25_04180 [Clostridia bacterium]|nr:hypothetical protein [Clostridia bacterium]